MSSSIPSALLAEVDNVAPILWLETSWRDTKSYCNNGSNKFALDKLPCHDRQR